MKTDFERLLGKLKVEQKKEIKYKLGTYTYRRVNPYNPLSYIVLLFAIPVAIFRNGFIDAKAELKSIFRWS